MCAAGLVAAGFATTALVPLAAPQAQQRNAMVLAWPQDVPNWDPNFRIQPGTQSLYSMVFDHPLMQAPDLKIIPHVFKSWTWGPDYLSLHVVLRDDVMFHNGDKLTAEDFRYTFFERVQNKDKIDIATIWRPDVIADIEVKSPTEAVVKLKKPWPTLVVWMAYLGNFIVPKAHIARVGLEAFAANPIGSGPYRLTEYQAGSRMSFEAFENYWGGKPKIEKVSVSIVRDASARAAAIEAGRADLTVNVPIRESERLGARADLESLLQPVAGYIVIQIRTDGVLTDRNVRVALNHAIDKEAISKAFYNGKAVPLSVMATPGTPSYPADYKFPHDEAKARELLAAAGFGPSNPLKLKFASFNGVFPSDYAIARAIAAMWKKVGVEAEVEVLEYAKYFELNRGGKLPEVTLYNFDNTPGDPEILSGYLLNYNLPFSPYKDKEIGDEVIRLFATADEKERVAGYRALLPQVAQKGGPIPIVQNVQTVVYRKGLNYVPYENFWVLPQMMSWK